MKFLYFICFIIAIITFVVEISLICVSSEFVYIPVIILLCLSCIMHFINGIEELYKDSKEENKK